MPAQSSDLSRVDPCICHANVKTFDCRAGALEVIFACLQAKEGLDEMSAVSVRSTYAFNLFHTKLSDWILDSGTLYSRILCDYEAGVHQVFSHPAMVLTCTVRCVTTCFCLMATGPGSPAAALPREGWRRLFRGVSAF